MKTKFLTSLSVFLFLSFSAAAQGASEFGILAGSSYYTGDVNHSKLFYSPKLAYGVLFRKNINPHHAYRFQLTKLKISGNDADFASGYQQARMHSFVNNIYEIGAQYEFNFFPYNLNERKNRSTYLTTGASFVILTQPIASYRPAFVIGAGGKLGIGKRLTIGAEWTYRYAFSDNLDGLANNQYDPMQPPEQNKQITNENSNDWYSLAGIVISYNFASTKKWCPAYDRPKN